MIEDKGDRDVIYNGDLYYVDFWPCNPKFRKNIRTNDIILEKVPLRGERLIVGQLKTSKKKVCGYETLIVFDDFKNIGIEDILIPMLRKIRYCEINNLWAIY